MTKSPFLRVSLSLFAGVALIGGLYGLKSAGFLSVRNDSSPSLATDLMPPTGGGGVGAQSATIYYVNGATGNDSNNGLAWATAKKTLSATWASATGSAITFWVAQGTYQDSVTMLVNTSRVVSSIEIDGGFIGTETALNQRPTDTTLNPTIIDANFNKQALCIWSDLNTDGTLKVDRFTLQHGKNQSSTQPNKYCGGGMGVNRFVTTIVDTIIQDSSDINVASYGGCLNMFSNAGLTADNLILRRCSATSGGGGLEVTNGTLNRLTVEDCSVGSATASSAYGGGMVVTGATTLTNSKILRNKAVSLPNGIAAGGAIDYRGGGIEISNNFFYGNEARQGSGIQINSSATSDHLQVRNNIFSSNKNDTGVIYINYLPNMSSRPTISNNIFSDNTATIGPSVVYLDGATDVIPGAYADFWNNIIAYNHGPQAPVGRSATNADYTWYYNDFYQNDNGIFVNPDDLANRFDSSNTEKDPVFASRSNLNDPNSYQPTKYSTSVDCGAIGWFLSSTDYSGNPRIFNSTGIIRNLPDLGPFEYKKTDGVYQCRSSDLNFNGHTDITDLGKLLNDFGN